MGPMMFTTSKERSIAQIGEIGLIEKTRQWLGKVAPCAPQGMGDDCAVLKTQCEKQQLLTTDSLSYGQHFDDRLTAADAGAKLIKRNLSDIAAMGGEPGPALLNLLCGPDLSIRWLEDFIRGVSDSSLKYGVTIVGGDVSALGAGQFSAVLTLSGTVEHPLLRSGASEGDAIYVTGTLGGSILKKHYAFEPRLNEGRWLRAWGDCSAAMDLTDGLAKDLPELVPNGNAAWLDLTTIPISEDAKRLAGDPLARTFCDGEDYELLFTVSNSADAGAFEAAWAGQFPATPLSKIGTIRPTTTTGARLINAATGEGLPWTHGFEHLKST
jgi:thiamine-monophosphate kinase